MTREDKIKKWAVVSNWILIIAWCSVIILLGYIMPDLIDGISEKWLQEAYGQIGDFEINAPQIQNPPTCSQVDISADKAYIPFQIKIFHDFSRVSDISFEQIGKSIPQTHTSPELMIFESNFIDEYQIHSEVNFDVNKKRAVYIEIWSQNNPSFKEIISFEGLSFCRTFNVKTAEAPKIPTRTEIIGEQAERAFEEMPLIKDAINFNTSALSASINWMFAVVVAALGVSAGQFFAYIGKRRLEKRRVNAFDNMLKVGSKYIAEFKKEHTSLKAQRIEEKKQMDQFIDMANVEFRSLMQELRKENALPPKASLEINQDPIEEAENTSILKKLYESVSDEKLKKYLKFFKDKTGVTALLHKNIIEEEALKREHIEEIQEEQAEEEREADLLPLEYADKVIDAYGSTRYRVLDDEQLRLLYRAFQSKNAEDPENEIFIKRLTKIADVLNIRAKEFEKKNNGDVKK